MPKCIFLQKNSSLKCRFCFLLFCGDHKNNFCVQFRSFFKFSGTLSKTCVNLVNYVNYVNKVDIDFVHNEFIVFWIFPRTRLDTVWLNCYLKELWNCISRITRMWSLFCSIRVYRSLHFVQYVKTDTRQKNLLLIKNMPPRSFRAFEF